jgi:hypothetical protein
MDEDPFNYFLTPAPLIDDGDVDADVFDAGIENPSSPKEIVRSVSPSTLSQGLSNRRPISPDFDSDALTTDDDEDDEGEEYVRFGGASSGGPFNFKLLTLSEFAIDGVRRRSSPRSFLSPSAPPPSRRVLQQAASFPGPHGQQQYQPRGRGGYGRGRAAQPRSFSSSSSRARPNHLWREPSPDVWSIEEETEEEMMSEKDSVSAAAVVGGLAKKGKKAKAFKKVRFVLPSME